MTIDTTQLLERLKAFVFTNPAIPATLLGAGIAIAAVVSININTHKPAPPSTRQSLQNISIQGCDYILFTIGEETNSNFAMAITHSGVCTNWAHHGVLLSEEEAKQLK